jgi:hypothetical protein
MRVEITITVLWTSLLGTFAKCRPALKMSVYRGRPEVAGPRSE